MHPTAPTFSLLPQHGISRLTTLLDGIEEWLVELEYESLTQLQGSLSQMNCAEPAAFERANYMRVLSSYAPDRAAQQRSTVLEQRLFKQVYNRR